MMEHLRDTNGPVNRFANTLRLIGIMLLVASTIGVLSYRSDTGAFWDVYTLVLLHLFVVGGVLLGVGEMLWKILLRNSDVSRRQLHFYDEEQ